MKTNFLKRIYLVYLFNKVGRSVFFVRRSRTKKHYLPPIIEEVPFDLYFLWY